MNTNSVEEDNLEVDVLRILERNGSYWETSARIGLEAGFDRANAGRNVRPILASLIKRGLVEEIKQLNAPIVYRLKEQE